MDISNVAFRHTFYGSRPGGRYDGRYDVHVMIALMWRSTWRVWINERRSQNDDDTVHVVAHHSLLDKAIRQAWRRAMWADMDPGPLTLALSEAEMQAYDWQDEDYKRRLLNNEDDES